MELFIAAVAIIGVTTTIAAIDESIDWMASYRREGDEDLKRRFDCSDCQTEYLE